MPDLDLTLERSRLDALRHGAVLVDSRPAVFRITGSGAISCLQGLLTNDLLAPGDGSLIYGAMLTPKGMIITDAWVIPRGDTITMIVPCEGRAKALEIFARGLPPRLARATDLTGEVQVAWLLGERGFQTLAKSGIGAPEGAGRTAEVGADGGTVAVAVAPEAAPFAALLVGPVPAVGPLARRLLAAGARVGDERDQQAARILAGWPALGAEIDERTLPQEVRYDEIGGVSYTKGCYTGQETVARLHFRGHTNRELRGIRWHEADGPERVPEDAPGLDGDRTVMAGEKEIGAVRSTLTVEGRRVGLALLRREAAPGAVVSAGGRPATVTGLPFGGDELDG
jgi:folate-binding protein YgfZ